jgi:hypothetical protein
MPDKSEDIPTAGWRPAIPTPKGYEIRPPKQWPKLQPFFELTAKHGRPRGPFDLGRQLPYND